MIQAYMLTRHATGSITSRHSFASKSQDSTVKSVQALISYGACSIMFTTNIAHGVRGYHSKCSDEIVIVGSLKFSSDPFGESRATWFVFSFFAVLCIVCFPLLSSMFDFFCGGSVVSAFVFLVDTMFVRSRWHFSFSRYSFLLRFGLYCWTCEALPPQSASNVAVWRSKTRPDIGTSFRANFGFIRRCFHCIAQRICWSACRAVLDLLIQVTSLLGWCSLRRFKSARTRETQPGCLKESFSQIIW